MSAYVLDTKLFGEIEITESDGLIEDFDIVLADKEMTVHFQVFEDVANDSTIKTIKNILDNIPLMYEKGKKAIIDGMDSNAIVESFIDDYFYDNDIDVYLDIFDVDTTEKVTAIMVAERLEPRAIVIANDKDGMIDCTFDFSLPEEYSDQLLVIRFNDKHEIFNITHES